MNTHHCKICYEKNVSSDHEVTSKHIKNKVLVDYNEKKKQFFGNRSGVNVSCNVTSTSSILTNCVEAKIVISIKPNEKATFNFVVKNECNKDYILLTFVQLTHSKLNFTITDSGMGVGGQSQIIGPKKILNKEISVKFQTSDIGQYESPIVFYFRKKDFDENIVIIRDMVVYVEESKRVHEDFLSPYTKKEVRAETLFRSHIRHQFHNDNRFSIPKNYKSIFCNNLKIKKDASEIEEMCLAEINGVFDAKMDKNNYVKYFHNLLWYEESTVMINIKNFNMSEVFLEKMGDVFSLHVPGLSEKRPSLLIDNLLHVKPSDNDLVMFEAFIKDIEDSHIFVHGFHHEFYKYYSEITKFDVRFFLSRIPAERMHRAVDSIMDNVQESKIFPTENKYAVKAKKITSFYNKQVEHNLEQRRAVESILTGTSGNAPFMVHGPPGTGKTITIVEAILQLVKNNPKNRILVCTDSNMAADHVASVIIQYKDRFNLDRFMLRANSKFRVWETLPKCLAQYSNGTNRNNFRPVSYVDFKSYNIVVTTLLHAAKYGSEARRFGHKGGQRPVSHLFIDEAAQASEPACLVPISSLLANNGQLVLSGDPQQLGPVVISRNAGAKGLGMSLMERLKKYNLYSDERNDPNYIVMLKNNFRSNSEILEIPNRLFYNGQLIALAGRDELSYTNILGEKKESRAIVFHGVLSREQRMGKSPSYFNTMEVELVQKYITALITQHSVLHEDIGVVTPYIRQVYHVKQWLQSKGYDRIEVGTVEAFQGKEKRVIIITTVRANCTLHDHDARFRLGFLVDDKRFNVALTRAKAKVIVIGNPLCLQVDPKWRAYIDKCREFGTYFGFDSRYSSNEDTHREISNLVPLLNRLYVNKK